MLELIFSIVASISKSVFLLKTNCITCIFIKSFATILKVSLGRFANFQNIFGQLRTGLIIFKSVKKKTRQKKNSWIYSIYTYLLKSATYAVHLVLYMDLWRRGVVVMTTAQLYSTKHEFSSAQVQILLAACRRFAMVRISDDGHCWK